MTCEISWNTLSLAEWNVRFARIERSTLPQSYDYARALCPLYHQRARWGLITIDGADAGLVQIMEAALCGETLHAVILDRGPLWLPGFGTPDHFAAFLDCFARRFPRRFGRRRRFIPELIHDRAAANLLLRTGFRPLRHAPHVTAWVDLTPPEDVIHARFKSGLRQDLRKASSTVLWDNTGQTLPAFLDGYAADRRRKGYPGAAPATLSALGKTFSGSKNLLLGWAMLDKAALAAILVLCHGSCATYQAGWTTTEGRNAFAHHQLLWDGMRALKARGIRHFDLGGINEHTAKGVSSFKENFSGDIVTFAGAYA